MRSPIEETKARLEAGDELRADGFFDEEDEEGGAAGELLEGVMLAAADSWEQRKVPYLGRLFSGTSFDSNVSVGESNYLLRLATRLTYRQLVLLRLWVAAQCGRYREAILSTGIDQETQGGRPTRALAAELDDLMTAQLIGVRRNNGTVGPPEPSIEGIADVGSLRGVDLATCLTPLGETLHDLLGLDQVPIQDLDDVLRAIRGETT